MKNVIYLFLTCVILILFALAGCDGGSPPPSPPPPPTRFTIKSFVQVGNVLLPNTQQHVTGTFPRNGINPVPDAFNYDFSKFTDSNGLAPVVTSDFVHNALPTIDFTNLGPPQDISFWLDKSNNCTFTTLASGHWGAEGDTIPLNTCGFKPASASPSTFDVNQPPATITLTGSDMVSAYGSTAVQWFNRTGVEVAEMGVLDYGADGSWITMSPPADVANDYSGPYAIVVFVPQSDGSYAPQAAAPIQLTGNDPTPPPPPPPPRCTTRNCLPQD